MSDYEDCLTSTPKMWVDTRFDWLNLVMSQGRGLPCGKIIELFGNEGTGKTALCQAFIKEYQKQGGVAIYLDFETSLDQAHLKSYGLDLGNLIYVDVETVEEGFDAMMAVLRDLDKNKEMYEGRPILFIWDSVALSIPKAEAEEKEHENSHIALLARSMGKGMRKLRRRLAKTNCTALFTNQIREKPGVKFGPNTTTPGGRALKFAASIRLQTVIKKTITANKRKNGKDKKYRKGYVILVKTIKTRFAPPLNEGEFILSFKTGADPELSLRHLLKEMGVYKSVGKSSKLLLPDGDVSFPTKEWRQQLKKNKRAITKLRKEYESTFFGDEEEED